jgi:hypothetical protein
MNNQIKNQGKGPMKKPHPMAKPHPKPHGVPKELGESGPVLLPAAARANIRAAERLVDDKIANKKERQFANQYLKDKSKGRGRVQDETVKLLSKRLRIASKADSLLLAEDSKAGGLLADPKIGSVVAFDTTKHKIELKVEGIRYKSGRLFYAPQGQGYSISGCKRFLARFTDKKLVAAAMRRVSQAKKKLSDAQLKAAELTNKSKIVAKKKPKKQLGASKREELTASKAKKIMLERQAAMQKASVKALKKAVRIAEDLLRKRKRSALQASTKRAQSENLDARELELHAREKRLFDREMELKSATERLEETARNLRNARDSKLVMDFPKRNEQLRLKILAMDAREKRIRKREADLKLKSKIMRAKVAAFNKGVEKSITSSLNGAGASADKWHHNAKLRISDEVKKFQADLGKINRKYATGYGAKMSRVVRKKVNQAVHNEKLIQKDMKTAAKRTKLGLPAKKP